MRAANTAEQALTIVERAFCAIANVGNFTIKIKGELSYFEVRLNIINSGRTAAINYMARANVVAIEVVPENFRFADYPNNNPPVFSVIAPQSGVYIPARIAIQDAAAAHARRKRILIYGWFEYNDLFEGSQRHRGEFGMELEFFSDPHVIPEIISGNPNIINAFNIIPYRGYNNYDDNCLYKPGTTSIANIGELPEPTIPPGVTIIGRP